MMPVGLALAVGTAISVTDPETPMRAILFDELSVNQSAPVASMVPGTALMEEIPEAAVGILNCEKAPAVVIAAI
jgi:hypothetical protein